MGAPGRLPCLLRGRLPASFERRELALAPGATLAFEEAEWVDALVVVETGEVELEARQGSRRRFRAGDVLWFAGLELRRLHNPGAAPAVLLAVSRRHGGEPHSA
jgi:quercetin dioxygenase-like cupin family protein